MKTIADVCEEIGNLAGLPQLAEDVQQHLKDNTSMAFRNHEGFVVVRPKIRNKIPTLQVEVAYCASGRGYKVYQESLERLALYLDCKQLEFFTVRKGFERLAVRLGYTKVPFEGRFTLWRKAL